MHRPMQKKYADQAAHGLSDWKRAGEDDLSTRFVIILENLHELDVIMNKKHAIFYFLLRGTIFAGASHASLRIFSFCCCYALFSL